MSRLNDKAHVGEGLRRIRLLHGYKQKELTAVRSVSLANAHERGEKNLTLDALCAYADFYNLPTNEFVFYLEHYNDEGVTAPVSSTKLHAILTAMRASKL